MIKHNRECPLDKMVIERECRHRFRIEERIVCEGIHCVRVSPLDKGFEDYATAIWPESWVYMPASQMELFADSR